jgi:hypothetical protein
MARTSPLAEVPVPTVSRGRQVFAPRQMAREAQHISDGASPCCFENLVELVPQDEWPDQRQLRLISGAEIGAPVRGNRCDQLVRLQAKIDSVDRMVARSARIEAKHDPSAAIAIKLCTVTTYPSHNLIQNR